MFVRACLAGSLIFGIVEVMGGCASNPALDSVLVSPSSQSVTLGQTAQFTATGTFGNAKSPTTRDVTGTVSWTSSVPSVATINSSGVATPVGAGTTTITASAAGYTGLVSSSGTLVVTGSSGGTASGTVTSIAIIPGAQTLSGAGATSQFLVIGTTSSGATVNMAGLVAWNSSSAQVATVGAASGLATAVGTGTTTITALYTTASGTLETASALLTVSAGTSSEKYTAVTITPGAQALSASGQTGQFIALATSGTTGLQTDVTNLPQIKWSSAVPTVVSVSATGLATGVAPGNTTVTAELTNPDSTVVSGSASVSVSITAAPEPLLSLTIIPDSITVGNLQDTGQFLAIGTFSTAPYVRDLTNSVTWLSSAPNEFPISTNSSTSQGNSNAGVVNAWWSGTAVIIAEATAPDGSVQTATATFNCPLALPNPNGNPPTAGSCYTGSQASALISTLTVYNEGLNKSGWLVTAPSATGTPSVLHCGPGWAASGNSGGSVCTATYPVGTVVTLTAPKETGVNFGGWSTNCTPTATVTAAGPNSCTVTLSSDDSVGAIFN